MIGIDWGTSSFRAFRLAADGTPRARIEAPDGILAVPSGGFPATLRRHIAPWLAEGERRVVVCGMAGSRQGWVEAPYLPCPAGAGDIAAALVPVPFDGAEVRLIPGLTDADEAGIPEVMRGEETQVLGALGHLGEALACLPGSHSKWACVAQGRITAFRTYLTGEAFAAIKGGTILGRMMRDGAESLPGFDRGVLRSADSGHLLHHLFGVRTLGLFHRLGDDESASYLSGLLIGHEIRAALPARGTVHLIGAEPLCRLYARAIAACGGTPVIATGDAAAGLALIARSAPWT
jgi:2-dehydro-3-deoxygalactonokinase